MTRVILTVFGGAVIAVVAIGILNAATLFPVVFTFAGCRIAAVRCTLIAVVTVLYIGHALVRIDTTSFNRTFIVIRIRTIAGMYAFTGCGIAGIIRTVNIVITGLGRISADLYAIQV